MIIKIPILLERVGDLADLGLVEQQYGLLNIDDVSYVVPQDSGAVIFIKSGILTDEEVEADMSHCHIHTTLTVEELYERMKSGFLTNN